MTNTQLAALAHRAGFGERTENQIHIEEFVKLKKFAEMVLAQQALDKKAENARELGLDYEPAQQEPAYKATVVDDLHPNGVPLEQWGRPAQQEPVAYLCENAVGHQYFRWKKPSSTYKPIALYTSPPAQRTWVGLTDEEIFEIHKQVDSMQYLTFGHAIEAKLKEKNT